MTSLEKRIARLEAHIRRNEEDAGGTGNPSASWLIVWHLPGESEEQALARWDLRRGDLPEGLGLSLVACEMDTQRLPMLVCHRQSGPASKRQIATYEQALQEALEWSPEERARQQQAWWARDRERLRQWQAQEAPKEAAG
jgi:hypothetical protein